MSPREGRKKVAGSGMENSQQQPNPTISHKAQSLGQHLVLPLLRLKVPAASDGRPK
jgi:hypothetical protein